MTLDIIAVTAQIDLRRIDVEIRDVEPAGQP
jgi:hypothetical protein